MIKKYKKNVGQGFVSISVVDYNQNCIKKGNIIYIYIYIIIILLLFLTFFRPHFQ